MKKQTVLDQIEIRNDGSIQVRIAKQVVDDDGSILTSEWHRTSLPPGWDIAKQMASVNSHLDEMGWPAVVQTEIDKIDQHASVAWTDDVKKKFQDKLKAEKAALAARLEQANAN